MRGIGGELNDFHAFLQIMPFHSGLIPSIIEFLVSDLNVMILTFYLFFSAC